MCAPRASADAVTALAAVPDARALAGGTNLVDLMKYDVATPVARRRHQPAAAWTTIERTERRRAAHRRAGAPTATSPRTRGSSARYPLLASAILAGASPQLRNAATTGGNLLQRTRCYYFYDPATPCNKREPGSGCPAIARPQPHPCHPGHQRSLHRHPSLRHVRGAGRAGCHGACRGPDRARARIAFADFHRLPGDTPAISTTRWRHGELITAIELPPPGRAAATIRYLKLRDRLSYAFALVSVAASLEIEDGRSARRAIALGGVAHKPWRDRAAEARAGRPAGRPCRLRSLCRRGFSPAPKATATNASRSIWRDAPSSARSHRPRSGHAAVAIRQARRLGERQE